ncbi:GNAT family N-acetyltransferase [Tropicimonas sp. IMCC6043]|uniref:GNAT family N-acetyltransferase n=1 Tax=Tropicimonas sp. IMCC6043 TaxID=2510645 RepID=UPI00101D2A95|nr:GNAT family N-acetyltransferase [Tropicimonas sp. IMCC6043]RYH11662.1 N-acetyltransferase [Tropicimonas sp. IMCC6043]
MALRITFARAVHPAVSAVLEAHAAHCSDASPPESRHYLPAAELDTPDITLWAAWVGEEIAGVGALKALSPEDGEIKSMHTVHEMRRRGVGAAILGKIESEAARRTYRALWLETGTMPEFAPARALYERHGFTPCPPFGDYFEDPNSVCYTKTLTQAEAPR